MIGFVRTIGTVIAVAMLPITSWPTSANAVVILNVDADGLLIGATGLNVGGTLFDIRFLDGSCIDIFDGCDETSDFAFTDLNSAAAAATVLLLNSQSPVKNA